MHTKVVKTMKNQVEKVFELLISKLQSHFPHMVLWNFLGGFPSILNGRSLWYLGNTLMWLKPNIATQDD